MEKDAPPGPSIQRDIELLQLSRDDIIKRVEALPERFNPLRDFLKIYMQVHMSSMQSLLSNIFLIKNDVAKAREQYYALWQPLGLPEALLKKNEPSAHDIPRLEQDLEKARAEEAYFLSCITHVEKNNIEPMRAYLQMLLERAHVDAEQERAHSMSMLDGRYQEAIQNALGCLLKMH